MPEPKLFECPACGSPLTTDGEKPEITCLYCGRTVIIPESLRVRPEPPQAPPPQTWYPPVAHTPAPSARAPRRGGGCGCLALMLIVIALVAVGYQVLLRQDKGLSSLQAAVGYSTPTPAVVPVSRPLTASLPRQAQYANLQFSVIGGTITNQIPADATNHESLLPRDRAHAYVEMKVNNPTTNGIVADASLVALRLDDGQRYQEESGWGDWIESQSSMAGKLYFTVPLTATWRDAQLLIGKAGKEPATIPLDGPPAQARYPLVLNDKGKATVQAVDYEIQSAAVDLDSEGKRADTGRRFLKLSLRIFNHNRTGSGVTITAANFRLVAGGDLLAPAKAPSEYVLASSVLQAEVVFDLPADTGRTELQLGDVGGSETRRLPVNIPAP
jgi:DNA-directed RNA polymerase subunit RPC12/RpoP